MHAATQANRSFALINQIFHFMPETTDEFFKPIGQHVNGQSSQVEDDYETPVQEIESLCMKCHENGITRLLLTSIPFFKEVIVYSFACEHCGNRNNEIQSAGEIRDKGVVYTVKATIKRDLNRQMVRSEFCTITLPEYELTVPPSPQKGQLTTIEGIIQDTIRDLAYAQPVRQHTDAATYDKIEALLAKMRQLAPEDDQNANEDDPITPFTFRLDDPSGNSFIEPNAELALNDPKWSRREYKRTKEQDVQVGLAEAEAEPEAAPAKTLTDDMTEQPDEVFSFPDTCNSCGATLETYMKKVDIPHFKEVMLMSTNCHSCGYRDNEIKSGGAIAKQAKKITLKVEDEEDLKRDILKSDTSEFHIPEIGLELNPGTLGGRFTTLEGLLTQVYEELDSRAFARGDSARPGQADAMETFLARLKQATNAEIQYTVVLDDPLANSYIQNPYAPDEDPNMTIEHYDRTFQQNEELGLNDIKVENYEGEEEARLAAEAEEALTSK